MNFLAHALLAGPAAADRLGALLGDFVKGPLPGALPAAVAEGVRLHRSIDSFADRHPAFQRSRTRVSDERRRYAGILVDMFYDHFLARHWAHYSIDSLPGFAQSIYSLLNGHEALLPPRLAALLPYMIEGDWLASYAEVDRVGTALDRMGRHRLTRTNPLAGSIEELARDYAGFEADFAAFFTDALAFAEDIRQARTCIGDTVKEFA